MWRNASSLVFASSSPEVSRTPMICWSDAGRLKQIGADPAGLVLRMEARQHHESVKLEQDRANSCKRISSARDAEFIRTSALALRKV